MCSPECTVDGLLNFFTAFYQMDERKFVNMYLVPLVVFCVSAGFDDGVIFVGDELPAASTDWRAKAVLMSDAIVCYVSSSAPTSAYMAMEMSR